MGREQRHQLDTALLLCFLSDCLKTMNSDSSWSWVDENLQPQMYLTLEFSRDIRPFHPLGIDPLASDNYFLKNNSSVRRHHGWLCSAGNLSIEFCALEAEVGLWRNGGLCYRKRFHNMNAVCHHLNKKNVQKWKFYTKILRNRHFISCSVYFLL